MLVAWQFTWQEESIKGAVTTRERLKEIKAVCVHMHTCVCMSVLEPC